MSLVATRKALFDFVVATSGFAQDKVYWENQNMVRAEKPYISLLLASFSRDKKESVSLPNALGVSQVVSNIEFVLEMSCYQDNSHAVDPMTVLLNVQEGINNIATYAILASAGIAYIDTLNGPTDISIVRGTQFEIGASMDIEFRTPWVTEDVNIGVIEATNIDAVSIDIGGSTVDTRTIFVDSTP